LTSRRKGHIEVFNRVAITIHKGKTMDILTEADTVSGWVGRPVKFGLIGYAYYVCEIVDALLPESDPHEELYNRFVRVLRTVLDSENPDSCREAVNGFSVHLLRSLGYLPHTDDLPEDQIVPRIESVIERRLKTPKIGLRMNR
jgi:DNA repair protein RecO